MCKNMDDRSEALCTVDGQITKELFEREKKKAYNTCGSQAVTHPSTEQAQRCLTSVIGREQVYSAWYGRRRELSDR